MAAAGMRELCRTAGGILMILMAVKLTVEVLRPRQMNDATVEMSFFSVPVIHVGMNME